MRSILSIALLMFPRRPAGRGDVLRRAAYAQLRRRARARGNSFLLCSVSPPELG